MVEVEGYLLCLFDAARHDPVADLMILEVGLVYKSWLVSPQPLKKVDGGWES